MSIKAILTSTHEVVHEYTPVSMREILTVRIYSPSGEEHTLTVRKSTPEEVTRDLTAIGYLVTEGDISPLIEAWEEMAVTQNCKNVAKSVTKFDTGYNHHNWKVPALSPTMVLVLRALQSTSDSEFSPTGVARLTGLSTNVVKKNLAKLLEMGLIEKVSHGYYKIKINTNISHVDSDIPLGIENVVILKKGFRGGTMEGIPSPPDTLIRDYCTSGNGTHLTSDKRLPTSVPGYPLTLPGGQVVEWQAWENGTQMVTISSAGNPPLTPGELLILIDELKRRGVGSDWEVMRFEVNRDVHTIRLEPGTITLQGLRGELLKVYNHGGHVRVEAANRGKSTFEGFIKLIQKLASGFCGSYGEAAIREAIREAIRGPGTGKRNQHRAAG